MNPVDNETPHWTKKLIDLGFDVGVRVVPKSNSYNLYIGFSYIISGLKPGCILVKDEWYSTERFRIIEKPDFIKGDYFVRLTQGPADSDGYHDPLDGPGSVHQFSSDGYVLCEDHRRATEQEILTCQNS